MKAAHPGAPGQHVEARHSLGVRLCSFDHAACLAHDNPLTFGKRGFVRPAAPAGSKSGVLGSGAAVIKGRILPPRLPRWARRPAIDSRGLHGVIERSVRRGIARAHRLPAFQVISELRARCFAVSYFGHCRYGHGDSPAIDRNLRGRSPDTQSMEVAGASTPLLAFESKIILPEGLGDSAEGACHRAHAHSMLC